MPFYKSITTIQARPEVKGKEKEILDVLLLRWSSCMRFAYKRLLEGKTGNELRERRQGNLYSRGDKSTNGNLNLRIVKEGERHYLRVNVGTKRWKLLELTTSHKKWRLFESYLIQGVPYSVRLKKKNGRYYAYITFEEELPEIEIGFEEGAIGIDLNAFPSHIAWAEIGKDGNLKSYGEIPTPHLFDGKKTKRDYFAWRYAHEIVKIALGKRKGIVLEKLKIKDKGFRGDYRGRKSRRIKHNSTYRKLKERIVHLARRYGIAVKEVSPAYTSAIGMLKYAPQLSLPKDVASAWVIARRGSGLSERIPKNYRVLIGSPQRESGRVSSSTEGRNPSAPKFPRVAVLTALFPLKSLLISGDVGRIPARGREFLLPEVGPMGVQIPPAGAVGTLNRRDTNTPAPELCGFARFG